MVNPSTKAKCDVCGNDAEIIEIANGSVYGAICNECLNNNLEDADDFSSTPC